MFLLPFRRQSNQVLFSQAPDSICILRLSAIGDVCNTIATVQAIQAHWPSTKITWITGKLEAQLIGDLPNVEVIVFDKKQGLSAYTTLWKALDGRKFDALLHMQYAIRASVATLGIKATYKLGFDKTRSQDFQTLFTNVKVPSPSSVHVADGLRAFATKLGVPLSPLQWQLHYSNDDSLWAANQLPQDGKTVVIVPGASKAYKNWTVEGYVALVHHAIEQGHHVILAGSPSKVEVELVEKITALLSKPVRNLVGQSTLKQMLALLDKADAVVAPDTGPAHMASAMNTPVLGLYAHHNPCRVGPYNYPQFMVSEYQQALAAEHKKPKSELNWRTRVRDESAMQRIQVEQVLKTFDKLMLSISE